MRDLNPTSGGETGAVGGDAATGRGQEPAMAPPYPAVDCLRARLEGMEQSRTRILERAWRFQRELDNWLEVCRSQRAWKLMLAVRVVYAAFRRRGWVSAAAASGALLFHPSRRRLLLAGQELPFPQLSDYLSSDPAQDLADGLSPGSGTGAGDLCELPLPRKIDIVILAIIDFEFRFQRPQQIAVEFASRGHRVFWIWPGAGTGPGSPAGYRTRRLRENLWEVRLGSPACDPYRDELDDATRQAMSRRILQLFKELEVADHVVLVQLPYWRRLALDLRESSHGLLAYDCMDDWDPFSNISDFIRSEERLLAGEADLVIVSAGRLAAKFEGRVRRMLLARNAADYEHFQNAAPHPELAALPRPIVGYFGAIADWIDLDLVREAAKRRPQYSFVLVGQVFGRDVRALERLPNVRLMGNRSYDQIPQFLASFDVCTIPFLVNEVTQATDPVKLYEYFSAGKLVVATRMSELACWDDAVYLADSADHYVELLDRAVGESSPALPERRRRIARSNTWAHRVDSIVRSISEAQKRTSIIIVTHQSEAYLSLCLESVMACTEEGGFELIVVDNASTDGTLDAACDLEKAGAPVRIIRLPRNEGFAAGNNRGAEAAVGEYLVLLNPDTIVTPGWLPRLRWHLEDDASVGVICPVTNFAGNEAGIQVGYGCLEEMETFSRRRAKAFWRQRTPLSMAPLFCGMLKTSLFRDAGGLDESYGIGMFEDDDFAQRILRLGKKAACAEDCFVHHFGQGSFGALRPAEYEALFERNRQVYERRWNTAWIPHSPRAGVRPASTGPRYDPAAFAAGWEKRRAGGQSQPASCVPAGHPVLREQCTVQATPPNSVAKAQAAPASAEEDPNRREVGHWIDFEARARQGERQIWLQHPRVAEHYARKARVDGLDWRAWLCRELGRAPQRVLELGCGEGAHLYGMAKQRHARAIVGLDLEESRFAATAAKCRADGIEVSFLACDVNDVRLPEKSFDLICALHSVHHFQELEHIFEQCNRALTDDGFVVFEEYVGPNRFQWTDRQLALTRQLLGLLPEHLRRYANCLLKAEEGRSTPEQVMEVCPSEAVRSEDIVPLFQRHFEAVLNQPLGGTIQHLLYNGIVHNFPDDDPHALHAIDCIDGLEQVFIEHGIIPSDFALLVGKKKQAGAAGLIRSARNWALRFLSGQTAARRNSSLQRKAASLPAVGRILNLVRPYVRAASLTGTSRRLNRRR